MPTEDLHPTLYPEINLVLGDLLAGVRQALGEQLVGLYLHGSLASGDFDPLRSDVDFLVVTNSTLSSGVFADLSAMHSRLRESEAKWTKKLEGSYIPRHSLRRHDPYHSNFPSLSVEGNFGMKAHGADWIIQRHILRECGVPMAGPPVTGMIDSISADNLRAAVREILHDWWKPILTDPSFLQTVEYQAFAVLTMCRALHTLQCGAVTSKIVAARWALATLDIRWHRTIEQALAWPRGPQPSILSATLDFISYTLLESQEYFHRPLT